MDPGGSGARRTGWRGAKVSWETLGLIEGPGKGEKMLIQQEHMYYQYYITCFTCNGSGQSRQLGQLDLDRLIGNHYTGFIQVFSKGEGNTTHFLATR